MHTWSNRLLMLSVTVLVGLGIVACGSVGKGAASSSNARSDAAAARGASTGAASGTSSRTLEEAKLDRDNDRDNPTNSYYDRDDSVVLNFGRAATDVEKQMIASVVERYFLAAAATDGVSACRLIYSILAEAIPEDYGHSAGAPALHGDTCAVVMSKLFKQNRSWLAGYSAALKVTSVRIEGDRGLALLNLGPSNPASVLRVHRDGQAWGVDKPLPNVLL
jgi:hypothetical protein